MGEMQKAWMYKEYGPVEKVIKLVEIPIPEISCPDQVLIKVMASGLNPIDYMHAIGKFRQFDSPLPLAKVVYGASHITATTSTNKLKFVKGLGADTVIDYTTIDYTQLLEKYDFVFDTVGEPEKSVKAVKKGGIVALITAHDNIPEPTFRFILTSNGSNLEKLTPYFESGKIKPILDPRGPYKFSEMIEGLKYLETGRVIGKLVVFPIG